MIYPPFINGIISAKVVVCVPFPLKPDISPVFCARPSCISFNKLLFPTPDCPLHSVILFFNCSCNSLIPILLTKTGDEPENNNKFGILSHETIHELITETWNLKNEYLTVEVSQFIKFYLKTTIAENSKNK